jgi:hypothetical protein
LSLFVEQNFWIFMILTVIMGGGAAYMAGRSLALGWKPVALLLAYMIPFIAGVRFLHYALFGSQLTSLQYFISHGAILTAFALLGYRTTRVGQMVTQYPWLYERSGPLSWRGKA